MELTREEALQELKARLGPLDAYLRDRGIDIGYNGKKHFHCLNPNHTDSHPSMNYLGANVYCHSCKATYDIIALMAMEKNMEPGQFIEWGYQHYNIPVKGHGITNISVEGRAGKGGEAQGKPPAASPGKAPEKPPQDFTAYIEECRKHIRETDYPQRRFISMPTAERYGLGYDPAFTFNRQDEGGNWHKVTWQALIIPNGPYGYIARNTAPDAAHDNRYRFSPGPKQPYNLQALQQREKPVFIVEGYMDALSVMEVGGEAIALGGTGANRLLQALENNPPAYPLIPALDKDKTGREAEEKLLAALTERGLPFLPADIAGGYKDANEALMKDTLTYTMAVGAAQKAAKEAQEQAREAAKKAYIAENSVAGYLQHFINGIADSVNTPCISTGFPSLDAVLDGGLYEGLYVIGAISSLGKTTLITQIADQIAQAGTDVLIFSLEMARNELIAKSISRHTLIKAFEDKIATANAKTARGITTGKRYVNYSKTEQELIRSSIKAYSAYAGNIYIKEGVGDIGASQIREAVEQHISFTGQKPIVIVDYLQILAPYNERYSDKQNNDKAMLELKRTSRDNKIPLIAISSFNRENYKEEVNMTAFKETGSIEYSSDVLIGLQLKGAGSKTFDATAEKKKDPRSIELVILKNRNGRVGDRLPFQYYPLFNYFKEG